MTAASAPLSGRKRRIQQDDDSMVRVKWHGAYKVERCAPRDPFSAEQLPWCTRFQPSCIAGNESARAEVQAWFQQQQHRQQGAVLVLQGPCGCGKSLTINLEIQSRGIHPVSLDGSEARTAVTIEGAVRRATALSVPLLVDDGHRLAEEPTGLAALLRFMKSGVAPAIICIMDSTENSKVRPILTASCAKVIQMQPVPTQDIAALLAAVAQQAAHQAAVPVLPDHTLQTIAEMARGDVRNAIIRMEYEARTTPPTGTIGSSSGTPRELPLPSPHEAASSLVRGHLNTHELCVMSAAIEGTPFSRLLCSAVQQNWPYFHQATHTTEDMAAAAEALAQADMLLTMWQITEQDPTLSTANDDRSCDLSQAQAQGQQQQQETSVTCDCDSTIPAQCAAIIVGRTLLQAGPKLQSPKRLPRWKGRCKRFVYVA